MLNIGWMWKWQFDLRRRRGEVYKLIIEDDEGHTTVVPLVKDEITIGRKEGNTIRLTERNVSRHHARLIKSNGSVFIEDLDSYNGVKVNGDRITARTTIREGDLVEIGDYHFALQWVGEDATEAPRPLTPVATGTPPPLAPAQARAAQTETPAAVMKVPLEQKKEADTARVRAISEAEAGRLLVLNTELAGSEYTLERTEMVLGRTEDSDIFLNHRSVSNRHAKIVFDGGIYRILDLDSANGVLVNGEEYSRVDLRRGDIIELGHVKIRYVAPGEEFQAISEAEVVEDGPTLTAAEPKGATVGKEAPKRRPGLMLGLVMAVIIVGLGAYYYFTRDQGKTESATEDTTSTTEPKKTPAPSEEDPAAKQFKEGVEKLGERDFDSAIAAFTVVLEKNPEYPGAASELARARKEKENSDLLAKARRDLAAKNYNSALDAVGKISTDSIYAKDVAELTPLIEKKYKSSHLYKAATYKDNGDLEMALRHVEAVLVVDEKNESALRLKKTISRGLQGRKVARVSTPPDREASTQPAKKPKKDVAAAKRDKKKEAKDLTTKAKKLVTGIAYASLGKRDRAAIYYKNFVDICPRHPRAPQVRKALQAFREYKKDHR
jgi:pSer/pThr/pTyr-binding forkhead associated (FHA) protein